MKGARDMDALSLLKRDHDEVKKLLEKLESTTERGVKTREDQFTRLKADMEVHESIEEEIFYPRLRENAKTKEIALEGYQEHHVVDLVMAELTSTSVDSEVWGAKFTVMKENIEHHIEEEEGEMFKLARQVLDEGELEELGQRMETRKKELQASPAA
jgi:hemerythrin-like domain-containing protein